MRTVLGVVLGFLFSTACAADDSKKELDRLQGEWQIVRIEARGKAIPVDQILDKEFVLKGDELIPTRTPKDIGKLALKPDKKPAWLDLTDRDEKTMPGIYRVEGDRWEICLGDVGETRPTDRVQDHGREQDLSHGAAAEEEVGMAAPGAAADGGGIAVLGGVRSRQWPQQLILIMRRGNAHANPFLITLDRSRCCRAHCGAQPSTIQDGYGTISNGSSPSPATDRNEIHGNIRSYLSRLADLAHACFK